MMKSTQGHEEGYAANNHGLYFDISTLALAIYSKDIVNGDYARGRLKYRLTKPYPLGHFSPDGSQPYELMRTNCLHYITFNLVGWMHAALMVESLRKAELPKDSLLSLFWVRHEDAININIPPVLLKATWWILKVFI